MRECDIHDTRSIKTNSAVNLSRQPGLELCRDLLQHLQGVPRTCSFYIILRTSTLLVSSLHSVLTYNNIMHILPLPPCGSYSTRVQNGYGQHRPCKIVLLTLVAPRGVTDLYTFSLQSLLLLSTLYLWKPGSPSFTLQSLLLYYEYCLLPETGF